MAVAIIVSEERTLTLSTIAPLLHDTVTGFGGADTPVLREIKQATHTELDRDADTEEIHHCA